MFETWWRSGLEILTFTLIFYYSFLFVKGTRAYQVIKGMAILLLIYVIAKYLELSIITFLLGKFFGVAIIAFVVLFQSEIRRALAAIGRTHFDYHTQTGEKVIDTLVQTVSILKDKYIGALIVIMRESSLRPYIDTGVLIDSVASVELLMTIFMPKTPLHDGAVIIDGNRITAASCLLPLSQRSRLSHTPMGTRHRAAIGLTEETDAIVIIVSEERGQVSIASGGKIDADINMNTLRSFLTDIYHVEEPKNKNMIRQLFGRLFSTGGLR